MDDPEHTRVRRLVNKGFTPRQVRQILPHVRDLSAQLAREIQDARGEVDFVSEVAIHMPADRHRRAHGARSRDPPQDLYRWSDDMMGGDGRTDEDDPALLAAMVGVRRIHRRAAGADRRTRRDNPTDDLISVLTQAHDEGALAELAETHTGGFAMQSWPEVSSRSTSC